MEEKFDVYWKAVLLAITAFLLGSLEVFGEACCGIACVIAISIGRKNIWPVCLATVVGMLSTGDFSGTAVNAIIICGIAFAMSLRDVIWLRRQTFVVALLGAIWYGIVKLVVYIMWNMGRSFTDIYAQTMLVFSLSVIYSKAFKVIDEDIVSVLNRADAALGVGILLCSVFYALPLEIGGITVAAAAAICGMLYIGYRFGMGLGLTWTVIAGLILTYRTGENGYLMAYTIMLLLALGIYQMLELGRLGLSLFFALAYYILGRLGYDFLLYTENVSALISAVFVFVLLPVRYAVPIDEKVRYNMLGNRSPEWANLVMDKVSAFAAALKRVDYTMADATTGISFGEIGEIIDSFTVNASQITPMRKTIEAKVMQELRALGVEVSSLMLVRNKNDKLEVYITMKKRGARLIKSEKIEAILATTMKVGLVSDDNNRVLVGRDYQVYHYKEKPRYRCVCAARVASKYEGQPSGDNFFIGDMDDGQKLMIISDGMGSGTEANEYSSGLIDTMEELLLTGIDKELAIKLVNAYLAEKNKGEMFATMDMLIIDTYTGQGRLFKQGAATTYIKRRDWLEEIKSTSLPMGVDERADCENSVKKFYAQDIIIMLSDGMYEELIYENKEDYVRNLILAMECDSVGEIADYIMEGLMKNSRRTLRDDATVLVCKLVKT